MKRFEVWLANLNPQRGTEVGKVRPVMILQTDGLNDLIESTIICPISSNQWDSEILRIKLKSGDGGLEIDSTILLDQLRAIDNRRFIRKLGEIPDQYHHAIQNNMKIILDLT